MKKSNFIISSLIIFIFLVSCNTNKIKSLDVYYYPAGISTPYAQFCSDNVFLKESKVRHKKVDDRDFLLVFEKQLKTFESSDENSVDSRVYILINYHDSNIDTLCIGETWGICLNNNIMKHNQKFHELVMDEIDFYDIEKYRKK